MPLRKELIEQLQYAYELEMAGVEHNLASTLISLQLGRHETSREHSVAPPPDLTLKCSELLLRQESLTAQISAERELPPLAASGTQVREDHS